jgi:hypothetical protein
MNPSLVFLGLAVAAALWSTAASLMILAELQRRGEKLSFLWLRLLLPRYVSRYRRLTTEEQGRPGDLFYHFVIPINMALLFAAIGLMLARA